MTADDVTPRSPPMKGHSRNVAASVRGSLLQLAKARGTDFDLLLNRYAVERLLFRLSQSQYAPRFVLTGATLFTVWAAEAPARSDDANVNQEAVTALPSTPPFTWLRPTRDVDLHGTGDSSIESVVAVLQEVIAQPVPDDGLEFEPALVSGECIREEEVYEGVRVRLRAMLAGAQIPLQIDVGFGDAMTPEVQWGRFPTLLPSLNQGEPRVRLYPRETVVAEKFEAMVTLGLGNSRLKDFYDLWILSQHPDLFQSSIDSNLLAQALRATFTRRATPLPQTPPLALTEVFALDAVKVPPVASLLCPQRAHRCAIAA